MCGIAGIIQQQSGYIQQHLQRMTDALAHRGPDGEGSWVNSDTSVLLGHRRLAIIDLSSAAAQPMQYHDRYQIVHNGELYNYIELRNELTGKGYSFRTQSDTEVILAAYDYWGDACTDYFDGMFAFAIWDEKEKELFAARDRFGEKPFFYYFNAGKLLFASEMKALWAAGIAKEMKLQLLFNFITIGYTDNPAKPTETFYKNIYKLPAASSLYYSFAKNELVIEKYWDIDVTHCNKKIKEQEVFDQFDHLFNNAVQKRLRSDVQVGTSLSGGLDSSSVVAIACNTSLLQYRPQCFTAVFPGFDKDETAYAKLIASQFGLQQHLITVSAEDLINDWSQLCQQQEEPFGSASIYAQYSVYKKAQEQGVKVLLDGQGADETLAGYQKYYKWFWQELFMKRRLTSSGEISAARALGINESFGIKNIIATLFPDFASVILERQYLVKALKQEDLTREFVQQQSKEAYYSTPAVFSLNGALYFNTITHGLEELLRYADRNSMAHGREVRLPFLSHELVEFIFSLPAHFKIRDGWSKWLLRKSMDKTLPAAIVWRKDKVGFEPPQQQWMQHPAMVEAIQEARKKLVNHRILKESVLNKPVIALPSHAGDNFDWRYLSAAAFL